jgi:hypothetical protein
MTSYSNDDYRGNNDPNNKLRDTSRIIDVAVLDSEQIIAPKELDAHVIYIDALDISLDDFVNLFYHIDKNTFQINKSKVEDKYLSFVKQTIHTNPFHLPESVIRLYSLDLGVEIDCLDPLSSMEISKQVLYYKSLTNMCSVKGALTFSEIIETILNRTDAAAADDLSDVIGKVEDGNPLSSVYHQLIVNARFYNANPAVRDIIVKFRYNVEFKGDQLVKDVIKSQIRPDIAF